MTWEGPLETLRRNWGTIPLAEDRASSADLLRLSDEEPLGLWRRNRDMDGTLSVRGWYRMLYADTVPGKRSLDVGSGFRFDSLTGAEFGAYVTVADIVPENPRLVGRVAGLLGVDIDTLYTESVESLGALPSDFDEVTAIGSLHNAPAEVMRPEYQILADRLRVGGPWWQLAYPFSRSQKARCRSTNGGRRSSGRGLPGRNGWTRTACLICSNRRGSSRCFTASGMTTTSTGSTSCASASRDCTRDVGAAISKPKLAI
jgi:hypothetical protein